MIIQTRLCECGCGRIPPIATRNIRGFKKGEYFRFVHGHSPRMNDAQGWTDRSGYRRHSATRSGQRHTRHEHVLIAERAIGHKLPFKAVVHHHDGIKINNANTNLVICENQAYHKLIHARMRILTIGGDPNTQKICARCKQLRQRTTDFYKSSAKYDGLHSVCRECLRGSIS